MNSNNVRISETRDAHLIAALNEGVQNLHAEMHPEIFKRFDLKATQSSIAGFLEDPSCICMYAQVDEQPAGYAIVFLREVQENAFRYKLRSLYVDQIAVLPAYTRRGIGELLLNEIENLAKQRDISCIELDHWSRNTIAAKWFRKHGFVLTKERLLKTI